MQLGQPGGVPRGTILSREQILPFFHCDDEVQGRREGQDGFPLAEGRQEHELQLCKSESLVFPTQEHEITDPNP